jgi:hypothetical protein
MSELNRTNQPRALVRAGDRLSTVGNGMVLRLSRNDDAASSDHITAVKPLCDGSVASLMTIGQLKFISTCLEYARNFTDEHLDFNVEI